MKAKIHGIEVEGTLDEILKFKDEMDKREEVKNFKVTYVFNQTLKSPTDASDIVQFVKQHPFHTYI